MRKKFSLALGLLLSSGILIYRPQAAAVEVSGTVKVELFTAGGFRGLDGNLGGTDVADLTTAAEFQAGSPTRTVFAPILEFPFSATADGNFRPAPSDITFDNYGVRMSGLLHPPTSGSWYFYLASGGGSELWISTDDQPANKVRVAAESAWSDRRYYFNIERPFPGLPTQLEGKGGDKRDDGQTGAITADGRYKTSNVSDPIALQRGRKYYFEVLMKSGEGLDHVSVWATQNKNPITTLATDYPDYPDSSVVTGGAQPLSGDWLSVVGSEATVILQQPASRTNLVGEGLRFAVTVDPGINAGALTYKWFQGADEILDLDGNSINSPIFDSVALDYTPPRLATLADHDTTWRVEITPENGAKLISVDARLSVVPDTAAPRMTAVTPSDSRQHLVVQFDTPLAEAGVVPGNFSVTGVPVDGATLMNPSLTEPSRVILHTASPYPDDMDLTVTASAAVKDLAGNAVAPENFVARSYSRLAGVANYLRFENEATLGSLDALTAFREGERVARELTDQSGVVSRFAQEQTRNPNRDDFFGLVRGWVTPPATGDYEFFVASTGTGVFWLSTNEAPENLRVVAFEPTAGDFGDFLGRDTEGARSRVIQVGDPDVTPGNSGKLRNRSGVYPGSAWPGGPGPIHLVKGSKYYAVGLHKAGAGSDGISVGVKKFEDPDTTITILGGNWIEGFGDPTASRLITVNVVANGKVRMEWTGAGRLQSAASVDGAYADVPNATSPLDIDPTLAAQFYRLK